MSVAFRRESDEEHLEPRFELPIPPGPNIVTAAGMALIREKVDALEALLPTIQEESQRKGAMRDLRYWRTRQATAQVAPRPSGDVVEFGCTVTYSYEGSTRRLTIVGSDEADPTQGLTSFLAPLCRAMIGAEPGDLIPFGGKADAIEILRIAASVD